MKKWAYLNNPFLIAGKKSYRQGLKLSTYYNAQLKANISDPFFAELFSVYNPLHVELSDAYSNWLAQGGTLKGKTLAVVQLLKLLCPTKVDQWQHAIRNVYEKGSPQFVGLFPRARKPFNTRSREMRIAGVKQLSTALDGIAALAAVKTDVDNFYMQLTGERQTQLGGKGTAKGKSRKVEKAIEKAAIVMFGDLGAMIKKFQSNLPQIEQYFDVQTIRSKEQLVFNRTIKTNRVQNIMQRTFTASDSITLINDGSVPLYFYLANNATTPIEDLTAKRIDVNHKEIVAISALGNVSDRYLNVYNGDVIKGHCIVELL